MRKFIVFALACASLACNTLAHAQQVDFAIGDSILWSPKNTTAQAGYIAPPEKGGAYPSALLQYRSSDSPFGINVEGAFRYQQGIYNFFQPYRPFL